MERERGERADRMRKKKEVERVRVRESGRECIIGTDHVRQTLFNY